MKLLFLTILFIHGALTLCSSQTIIVREQFAGYGYYQGSKEIPNDRLEGILRSNKVAFKMLKSAESDEGLYEVVGFVGGALIGWPLNTWIAGGEPEWILAAFGGGLIVATIPLGISISDKRKKAVDIYNSGLKSETAGIYDIELRATLSSRGIGISFCF